MRRLLTVFLLFWVGIVSIFAQNEFSIKDSDESYPSELKDIRTYLNNKNRYVFAIYENCSDIMKDEMDKKKYSVLSVDRIEAMKDDFDGTIYVTHFTDAKVFKEEISLPPNTEKKYYTGVESGTSKSIVFQNNNGNSAGIINGGCFYVKYAGPHTNVIVLNKDQSYAAETFRIPKKIDQVIKYIDKNTKVEIATTEHQYGIEGQYFTTKQKSITGYFVRNLPKNTPGHLSPYQKGYTFTKYPFEDLFVAYKQLDDQGTMEVTAYYKGKMVFYSDNVEANIKGAGFTVKIDGIGDREFDLLNPYIPKTIEIVYEYERIANVIYTSDDSDFLKSSKPYTNDPNNITKVLDEIIPTYDGWEAYYKGQRIQEGTSIEILDPAVDTIIEYRRPANYRKYIPMINPNLRMKISK